MTIIAAYIVSDGVVFGADSTATITTATSPDVPPEQRKIVQLQHHAQKIYEIGLPGSARLAFCVFGANSVGKASHMTIAARLSETLTPVSTVSDAKDRLKSLIDQEPDKEQGDFGYLLGGVDQHTKMPDLYSVDYIRGETTSNQMSVGSFATDGSADAFQRVWQGYDTSLPDRLLSALKVNLGTETPRNFDDIFKKSFSTAIQKFVVAGSDDIPLRDAIDRVYACIYLTVKVHKFRHGIPTCGGPIELGFIPTDGPFQWVKHKPFDSLIDE